MASDSLINSIVVWLIYRYNEKIGQSIFNYFFVLSMRKITMAYITTVAGINAAFPFIELAIDANHNITAAFSFNGFGFDWAAVTITDVKRGGQCTDAGLVATVAHRLSNGGLQEF